MLPKGTQHERNLMGIALYALNNQAVTDRYGEEHYFAPARDDSSYRYQDVPGYPVQRLKSLRCLIYQCGEGKVPETPLFHEMEKRAGELAMEIVQKLPEWDAAEWG